MMTSATYATRLSGAVYPPSAWENWRTWLGSFEVRAGTVRVQPGDGTTLKRDERVRDPSDSEDIRKVEAFLAGEARAFEDLFDKYREKVFAVAYRFVRNKEDALEVTQDVFLRVYQNLKQFKTESKFFTWLYRIAVNRAIDFTRSRKAHPVIGLDPAKMEQLAMAPQRSSSNPVDSAQDRELEEYLQRAVETLSPKHRAVFVLHAAENKSYKQIAEVLDCNIGTVMSRLFYARKKLMEVLSGYGVEVLEKKNRSRGST